MVYNDRFIDHITTTVLLITTPKIEHGMRWNESVLPCSHARSCKQPCNKNTSSCRSDCVFSTACTRPPLQCALYLTRNLYCKRTGLRSCSYRGPMPGQKKNRKTRIQEISRFHRTSSSSALAQCAWVLWCQPSLCTVSVSMRKKEQRVTPRRHGDARWHSSAPLPAKGRREVRRTWEQSPLTTNDQSVKETKRYLTKFLAFLACLASLISSDFSSAFCGIGSFDLVG